MQSSDNDIQRQSISMPPVDISAESQIDDSLNRVYSFTASSSLSGLPQNSAHLPQDGPANPRRRRFPTSPKAPPAPP